MDDVHDVVLAARERIMLAAVELAGQQGVHRVTMSAVAAQAKVSRPTLYGYFPDVAHVLEAWVDREVAEVRAQLQNLLDADPDPVVVLSAYIDHQLAYFAESPTRALITAAALGSPPESVARHIEGFQADVRTLLTDLRGRHRIRPGVDVDLLAGLVVAGITAVAPHVVTGRLTPLEARTRLLDVLLHGALGVDGACTSPAPGSGDDPSVEAEHAQLVLHLGLVQAQHGVSRDGRRQEVTEEP